MNALENGAKMEAIFEQTANEIGYKRMTTFARDFGMADALGIGAVQQLYDMAFDEWKDNVKYIAELSLTLNWACWYYYEKSVVSNDMAEKELTNIYRKLYSTLSDWVYDNMSDEELSYYHDVTD